MAIWISLAVVLCLIPGHDSASTKIGCVNAVKVISSNGTLTYTCQAQNKDNNITWISNGERMPIVLAKCLNGSTTCLTTDPSVHASRTETGRSELKIIGSVGGKDIKCYESSDSEEVTCSQSTTAVTSTTGQGNHNSDNQSEPSAGSKIGSENPSFTPRLQSATAVTATTRPGNQSSDSNPTSTKTTITGVSNQIFTRDERTKQPSSAVSTAFDRITELSSQNNITEVSAHGDITESQGYVYTEIIGEETSSGGVKLTTASTTTVSPVTDSTQTLVS